MATTTSTQAIAAGADAVWDVGGDFGALNVWFPGIGEFRADGDVRVIGMGPGVDVTETQIARDEAGRSYTYRVESPLPATRYDVTFSVAADGDGCVATITAEIEPDDFAPIIQGIYDDALLKLKAHCES